MTEQNYNYTDHLHSERLVSRFLKPEDIAAWKLFFEDKEAVELFPEAFLSHGDANAEFWVKRQMERYQTQAYGLQALIDRNTGAFVGQCGLLRQDVDGLQETEVGYHIFKKYWGRGYAPEAARMFIDFAFANGIPSVISIIDVRNKKSQGVAEKNGLSIEKQTTWAGLNVFVYRIQKP